MTVELNSSLAGNIMHADGGGVRKFLFIILNYLDLSFLFFQMIEKRNRRSPESRDIFELHYQTVNYSYNSISEHQDAERKV